MTKSLPYPCLEFAVEGAFGETDFVDSVEERVQHRVVKPFLCH